VTPEEWKLIEDQITAGLSENRLSSESPIAAALDDLVGAWGVRWISTTALRVAQPEDAGAALDRHLAASLSLHQSRSQVEDKAP
jgi:hypothetical protein